jgi:hypothetical protein
MSQLNSPLRRASGELDVFTALLGAAALILILGVVALVFANTEHSTVGSSEGGPFTVVK